MTRSNRRVAHLSTVHPARDNRIFHKECRALSQAGIDVWLAVADESGMRDDEGVRIEALPVRQTRLSRSFMGQLDAIKALIRIRPFLVHFHDPELIPAVVLWKFVSGGRAIYDAHEDLVKQISEKSYLPRWSAPIFRTVAHILTRLADRTMDGIVAATPAVAGNYSNGNTVVIHNYPWLSEFQSSEYSNHASRTLVYVGAITRPRGFSKMLRTVEALPQARLLLAGLMDDECHRELGAVDNGGIVEYLGAVEVSKVPRVISRGSVGLVLLERLPNFAESLPTKMFEYMAAGIPFVATDFPYWRQLVGDSNPGIFVDVDDSRAIETAVQELLDDEEAASQMGKRGMVAVQGKFNFDAEAQRIVEFTQSLLDWRPSSGPVSNDPGSEEEGI